MVHSVGAEEEQTPGKDGDVVGAWARDSVGAGDLQRFKLNLRAVGFSVG